MLFGRGKDRRRARRQWVTMPVLIRGGEAPVDGHSINLSEGGIYLFAAANFPPGSQVEVEFRPPARKQVIRIAGTVRRRLLYLYAIEFLSEDAAAARARPTAHAVSSGLP